MGNCKDCKFWDSNRNCLLTVRDLGEPDHPESKAIAEDDADWYATLKTDADFGCVQFEVR